jgi:hypothetical protein
VFRGCLVGIIEDIVKVVAVKTTKDLIHVVLDGNRN